MKKPGPEDRDRHRRREEGEKARRMMQEILDRAETRRLEREAWRERSFFRRLLPW